MSDLPAAPKPKKKIAVEAEAADAPVVALGATVLVCVEAFPTGHRERAAIVTNAFGGGLINATLVLDEDNDSDLVVIRNKSGSARVLSISAGDGNTPNTWRPRP